MEDPRLLSDIWTVILAHLRSPYTRARLACVARFFARVVARLGFPAFVVTPSTVSYEALLMDASWDIMVPYVAVKGVPFHCCFGSLLNPQGVYMTGAQRRELDIGVGESVTVWPCGTHPRPCHSATVVVSFARGKQVRHARPDCSRGALRARLTDGMIMWPRREYKVVLDGEPLHLCVTAGKGLITKDTMIDFQSLTGFLIFPVTFVD